MTRQPLVDQENVYEENTESNTRQVTKHLSEDHNKACSLPLSVKVEVVEYTIIHSSVIYKGQIIFTLHRIRRDNDNTHTEDEWPDIS